MFDKNDKEYIDLLKGWIILIFTTILAGVSFYTAEYIYKNMVMTILGYISTAFGWYYYGINHGWYLKSKSKLSK